MLVLKWVFLGVLQGLTEFLPVSSSGHLVLAKQLLHVKEQGATLEVVLHLASALVIIILFRRDVWAMAKALFGGLARAVVTGRFREEIWERPPARTAVLLLLATVPAGALYAAWPNIENQFNDPFIVGPLLVLTGTFLWFTRYAGRSGEPGLDQPSPLRAFLIGCAQAVAMLPGISRSGATISTSLALGMKREEAVRFSFLLFLPAGLGAALLKLPHAMHETRLPPAPMAAGFAAAAVVSWLALLVVRRVVKAGRLHWFAPYCWLVGAAVILLYVA